MKKQKPKFRDLVIIRHNPQYPMAIRIIGRVRSCYRGSWGEDRFCIDFVNYNDGYPQHQSGFFGLGDLEPVTKQSLLKLSRFYKFFSIRYEKLSEKLTKKGKDQ